MFSSQLKYYRRQAGLTQLQLAAKLFVSQQTVAKWETDGATPNPETISKLATLFGVSTDKLLGRESANNKPTANESDGLTDNQKKLLQEMDQLSEADQLLVGNLIRSLRAKNEQSE